MAEPLAVVIMGSSSDAEIMSGADLMLKEFDISVDKQVISAHRNARKLADYIAKAEADGVEVIIAGAGMSAHLPGAIAALTTLPVIGVPIAGAGLGGLDALLSMVQMPSGVPVAVMAINGAKNAAILAAEILALKHSSVKKALFEYRTKLAGES